MLSSEKKSFLRFFTIYTLLITTVLITVSIIYYNAKDEQIALQYKSLMQELSQLQIKRLKWLHNHFPKYNRYPRDERYNSAIYDLEYQKIFSTLQSHRIDFTKTLYFTKEYAIYVTVLSDYYLGAKYLFVEIPKNRSLVYATIKNILLYGVVAWILFLILGYYLAKLFIKPMRESIELLDNFIKDTTHEINTPISIINANIEMLENTPLPPRDIKKIKRVKIASRTLETIYKDLKISVLSGISRVPKSENIDMKSLLQERLEYFAMHIELKKITIELSLQECTLKADKMLIERLVDNLLSNAIKYNRVGGFIKIGLSKEALTIEDGGIGIKQENLRKIFERYRRFNRSEGGFGIGLNIVQAIAKTYNFKLHVTSWENRGTKVVVQW